MILYHAGEWGGKGGLLAVMRRAPVENVLISFAYLPDVEKGAQYVASLRAAGIRRVFLDSGAFTAWTKGRAIPLPELHRAIDVLKPDVFVQLDVIGDAPATRRNLELMREAGYRPIPVFTRGAPFGDLRRLLDEGETYICLGNIAKATRGVRREWSRQVFALARDWMRKTNKPLPRFHAFGVTDPTLLGEFPFYSADSSAAITASAFGSVLEFRDGRYAQADPGRRKKYAWRMPHLVDKVAGEVRYLERRVANVRALNAMAEHVTKLWRERGITWDGHGA